MLKAGVTTAFFQNFRAGTWFYTLNLLQAFDELSEAEGRIFSVDFLGRPVEGLKRVRHLTFPFPGTKLAKIVWPNWVLPRRAHSSGLDVVHATTHYGTFAPCRYRNVITIHDVTPLIYPGTHGRMQVHYHRHILPHVLKRADAVITISECSRRDILRYYKIPEEKVQVIAHGVHRRFSPQAASSSAFAATLPERYILNIGTLEARKNLPRLLEAYAAARAQGLPHKLLIGGARGWRLSDLAGIVEKHRLEDDVVFLGFVEDADLPLLYARAEFFVYPSLYEGFGMPILEAMACGTPTITSNCSSMPEVAGDAALLVDPFDTEDIARNLLRLGESSELRASLRDRGLERAALFSWERTARETMAVYERLA